MSLQTLFDQIVDALVEQGEPSVRVTPDETSSIGTRVTCMYRGTNPATGKRLKCAAGQAIPDGLYHARFDANYGMMFSALPPYVRQHIANEAGTDATKATQFMQQMQDAHDEPASGHGRLTGAAWLRAFLHNAQGVAERHGLNRTSVEAHIRAHDARSQS